MEPDGFTVYRGDRTVDSGKELGTGGVCLFVNDRWCTNFTAKGNKCREKSLTRTPLMIGVDIVNNIVEKHGCCFVLVIT